MFNSKCHFSKCHSLIELSILLPSVLPKLRQQPGPGPAGSWAGPAWFKMLLGLGGNQGGGGAKG